MAQISLKQLHSECDKKKQNECSFTTTVYKQNLILSKNLREDITHV